MNPHARVDGRQARAFRCAGDFERLVHRRRTLTNPNRQNGLDPGSVGAAQNLVSVRRSLVIEVEVRVSIGQRHRVVFRCPHGTFFSFWLLFTLSYPHLSAPHNTWPAPLPHSAPYAGFPTPQRSHPPVRPFPPCRHAQTTAFPPAPPSPRCAVSYGAYWPSSPP